MALSAGSAFLKIIPSFDGLAKAVQAEAIKAGREAGKSYNDAFEAETKRRGTTVPGPSKSESTKAGAASAGAFADAFRARLEAVRKSFPDIQITADSTEAQRELAQLNSRIRSLAGARIGIDISEEQALAKLEDLKQRIERLSKESPSIEVRAATASALAQLAALQKFIDGIDGEHPTVEPHVDPSGDEAAGAFSEAFRKRLEAASKSLPPIQVGVAKDKAEQELRDLQAELAALSGAQIGVDLNEGEALARLDELKARLDRLGATSPSVQIRVDAGRASAELALLQTQLGRVGAESPTITPEVNPFPAIAGIGLVAGALALLSPALIPIAAAGLAAFAGLAAGALVAATGIGVLGLGLFGVLKAVVAGKKAQDDAGKDAKDLAQKQVTAANAADQLANAQRGLANATRQAAEAEAAAARAVEDAQRRVGEAQEALTRARRDAVEAAEDAARRVTKAEEDAAQASVDAAEKVKEARERGARSAEDAAERVENAERAAMVAAETAADRVTAAEQSLSDAQDHARDAQEKLTDARKAAAKAIEELDDKVRDNALSQRQAALDVEKAEAGLNFVRELGSSATARQREQAQLAYDEAIAKAKDLAEQQRDLTKEQKDAHDKGVEGASGVVDAQRDVVKANEDIARAEAALAKAREEQARQAADSAREIADARRDQARAAEDAAKSVGDALRDQARSETDSARSIADARRAQARAAEDAADSETRAVRAVAEARRGLADAERRQTEQALDSANSIASAQSAVVSANRAVQQSAIAMGDDSATAAAKFRKEMDKLSPAGQSFVDLILNTILPGVSTLQRTAEQGLLPGLEDGIRALAPLWPGLIKFVDAASHAFGDLFRDAGHALSAPFWQDFLTFLTDTIGPNVKIFGTIVGGIVTGIAGLYQGLAPVIDQVGTGIAGLAGKFADFGAKAASGKSDSFNGFVSYLLRNGPAFADFLTATVDAFTQIVKALAPFGEKILPVLTGIMKFVAGTDPDVIAAIAVGILAIVGAFTVAGLVTTVLGLAGAILAVTGSLALAIGLTAGLVLGIPLLIAGLVYLYLKFQSVRDVVDAVVRFVREHWLLLGAILLGPITPILLVIRHFGQLKDAASAVKNWIVDKFSELVSFITGIPNRIGSVGSRMFDGTKNGATAAKDWIVGKFDALVTYIRGLPGRIATAARGLFDGIKDAFKGAINFVIDGWNNLSFKLPSVTIPHVGTFGGWQLDTPNIPRLQFGGFADAWRPHLVGEVGPELFMPGIGGTVISNAQILAALHQIGPAGNPGLPAADWRLGVVDRPALTDGQWSAVAGSARGTDGASASGGFTNHGPFIGTLVAPEKSAAQLYEEIAWHSRGRGDGPF